jgi:hypothetical protein
VAHNHGGETSLEMFYRNSFTQKIFRYFLRIGKYTFTYRTDIFVNMLILRSFDNFIYNIHIVSSYGTEIIDCFVCSQYSIHCIIVYLEINKAQKSLWGRSLCHWSKKLKNGPFLIFKGVKLTHKIKH